MSAANPYASHLAGKDPLEVIAATPGQLASFVRMLGPERVEKKPAPGKWSAREIVCHLADCEVVFSYRLRQTLAQDNHVIQPFDQDKWAATYGAYDAPAALAVFSALRRWNLSLIHAAPAEAFSKRVTHPERGELTFKTLVETMGGHDLNHVKQLEAIAGRQ
ncbi:MAG TPA: DinB family protein [Candidatus Acidoferrales bacterium]|nr:DinB family protein [Candidatus Acidoferrales bacterium]